MSRSPEKRTSSALTASVGLAIKVFIPSGRQSGLVLPCQLQNIIQPGGIVTSIPLHGNGLQPDFCDLLRVNHVDMRWLANVRRIEPELVTLDLNGRHGSGRLRRALVRQRGDQALENPFAV